MNIGLISIEFIGLRVSGLKSSLILWSSSHVNTFSYRDSFSCNSFSSPSSLHAKQYYSLASGDLEAVINDYENKSNIHTRWALYKIHQVSNLVLTMTSLVCIIIF